MRINGSNVVQGLFNFNTAPSGTIYTKDDLVLYNNILYTCLNETSNSPELISGDWEYYLNKLNPVDNYAEAILPENSSRLVSAKVLQEFLANSMPGANYNGDLKAWTGTDLSTIPLNTRFRVFYSKLQEIKSLDPSSLPFNTPEGGGFAKQWIINTMTNLTEDNNGVPTTFFQELIEFDLNTGKSNIWKRSGPSLSAAPWESLTLATNVQNYIDYLEDVSIVLNSQKSLYDSFLQDVSNGEYKIWKSLNNTSISGITTQLNFIDNNTSDFVYNKYYKLFLNITESGNKFKDFIEISPQDHSFLNVGESFSFKRVSGLTLTRIQSNVSRLNIPANIQISGGYESDTFIV